MEEYESLIFAEEQTIRNNLGFLEPEQKALAENLLDKRRLEMPVKTELIQALNKALEKVAVIELNLNEILGEIVDELGTLPSFEDFTQRLGRILDDKRKEVAKEAESIRVKIIKK